MDTQPASCASCFFWLLQVEINSDLGRLGQCRRHAPTFVLIDGKGRTRWPLTLDSDVCGDHAILEDVEISGD